MLPALESARNTVAFSNVTGHGLVQDPADLAEIIGQAGKRADDRTTRLADYLASWLEWKSADLKQTTLASYREAVTLYFIPPFGHLRVGDLREQHIRELHAAMRKISTAEVNLRYSTRLVNRSYQFRRGRRPQGGQRDARACDHCPHR